MLINKFLKLHCAKNNKVEIPALKILVAGKNLLG